MTNLMALGLVLRRAYEEWLGEQLSGWLPPEVWIEGEPEPLKALAAGTAAVLFQCRQFAALESWLTAGYLPGDLATFEPQAANLTLDPSGAISGGFVPLTALTDKGSPSVRETGRPYYAVTPPFQASASPSAFDDHINQETPEKARAVEPPIESWLRQIKGLRDLAAFVQGNRQEAVQTYRFPGPGLDLLADSKPPSDITQGHTSQTRSTPYSEASAMGATALNHSQRARKKNLSPSPQLSLPTGEEEEMESLWNFLKQPTDSSHLEPEMLLSRAVALDEVTGPSRTNRQVLGASNTGEPISIKAGDRSLIKPSAADSGPGAKVLSEPGHDPEKSLSSQISLESSAPVDLEAILEAIAEEVEREFKRIYGR